MTKQISEFPFFQRISTSCINIGVLFTEVIGASGESHE